MSNPITTPANQMKKAGKKDPSIFRSAETDRESPALQSNKMKVRPALLLKL